MAKEVNKLKPKHKFSLWLDPEDDVWYYDAELEEWYVLMPELGGGFSPVAYKPIGPFRKLYTTWLKDCEAL